MNKRKIKLGLEGNKRRIKEGLKEEDKRQNVDENYYK